MANQLALLKRDTVDVVAERIRQFQERGEIHFPPHYSPENALKSAWLVLQNTKDKNGNPVLQTCTKDSIANALLDMVVQGLNPIKKQGYFIAYGRTLVFQRSYFGTMAVTKRVTGAKDIIAQVVYADDDFEYEIDNGRKRIVRHVQSIKNIDNQKIVAAYCTILFDDGRWFTEIMTWDEIQKAWSKSPSNPNREGSPHQEFPQEMAKKTVINRTCKLYINSSDDSSLVIEHFNRSDDVAEEAQLQQEIEENANKEPIDAEFSEVDESEEEAVQDEKQEAEEEKPEMAMEGPGF